MKSNLKLKMAIAASGLLASGVAFAGAPIAFDQFTATAGVITDTSTQCNGGGWTCVNLDATGVGILTQQITDPVSGIAYLRNINVENTAEGAASSLAFSNEVYVYASGINSNNVGLKQRVGDGNPGGMMMTVELYENAFRSDGSLTDPTGAGTGAGAEMLLVQSGVGGTFQQEGVNSNVRQRIDQNNGGAGGRFNHSVVAGNGQGLFEPTEAGTLGGTTIPAVAYAAGDALAVTWVAQNMPGAVTGGGEFGAQTFYNYGTATGATVLAGTAAPVATGSYVSNDGSGFVFTSNGPWEWPTAIFDLGGPPTPP